MRTDVVVSMSKGNAAAEFDACLEQVLAHTPDQRTQIILQMMAASVDADKLGQLQQHLAKLPDNSPEKNAISFQRIAEQFAGAVQQVVALDLDRTTPLKILGIGRATSTLLFCAKSMGHDGIMACGNHAVNNWLLRLYRLPRFEPKKPADLPEGQFDLIVSSGNLSLGTKRGWADFALPLAARLKDGGRIFVVLPKEANPKRNYYPDIVISKLAQIGTRVSSKGLFVLLDKNMIKKFEAEQPKVEAPAEPPAPPTAPAAQFVERNGPLLDHREPASPLKPFWKTTTVLIGGFVILIGFLVATWAAL